LVFSASEPEAIAGLTTEVGAYVFAAGVVASDPRAAISAEKTGAIANVAHRLAAPLDSVLDIALSLAIEL
jgi:hypothetical protein